MGIRAARLVNNPQKVILFFVASCEVCSVIGAPFFWRRRLVPELNAASLCWEFSKRVGADAASPQPSVSRTKKKLTSPRFGLCFPPLLLPQLPPRFPSFFTFPPSAAARRSATLRRRRHIKCFKRRRDRETPCLWVCHV